MSREITKSSNLSFDWILPINADYCHMRATHDEFINAHCNSQIHSHIFLAYFRIGKSPSEIDRRATEWEEENYRYGDYRAGKRDRRSILSGSRELSEKPTTSQFYAIQMFCSSCSRPPASHLSPSAKTSNHSFFTLPSSLWIYTKTSNHFLLISFSRFCITFSRVSYLCSYDSIPAFWPLLIFVLLFLLIILCLRPSPRLFYTVLASIRRIFHQLVYFSFSSLFSFSVHSLERNKNRSVDLIPYVYIYIY